MTSGTALQACEGATHRVWHADLDVQLHTGVAVGHQLPDGRQRVELDRVPARPRRGFLQVSGGVACHWVTVDLQHL